MSKVGNVENMFGEQFDLVTTNASGERILNDNTSSFVTSSLIVASPVDINNNDIGTPSLLVTDYEGKPLRLTYTLITGGGLVVGSNGNNDIMRMSVQDKTLKTDNSGTLYVDATGLIPKNTVLEVNSENEIDLYVDKLPDNNKLVSVPANIIYPEDENNSWRSYLSVNSYNLIDNYHLQCNETPEESLESGYQNQFIKLNLINVGDEYKGKNGYTLISEKDNYGKEHLTVVTQNLTTAGSKYKGVVKIDNSTIKINDIDQITVNTKQLKRISNSEGPGLVFVKHANDDSIMFYGQSDGQIGIKTKNFPKCGNASDNISDKNSKGYGVAIADGTTIRANNIGEISVLTDGLTKATNKAYGIVRPDNRTISVNGGVLSIEPSGIADCTTVTRGLCKIDNTTIGKNASGQLYVKSATAWNSRLALIEKSIDSIIQQYTDLQWSFNSFVKKMTTTQVKAFNVMKGDTTVQSIYLYYPYNKLVWSNTITPGQVSIGGQSTSANITASAKFDTSSVLSDLIIQYAAGYKFYWAASSTDTTHINLTGLTMNGAAVPQGQGKVLSRDTAIINLEFTCDTYIKNNKSLGNINTAFLVTFYDSDTNTPLCSFNMTVILLPATSVNNTPYVSINKLNNQILPEAQKKVTGGSITLESLVKGSTVLNKSIVAGNLITPDNLSGSTLR